MAFLTFIIQITAATTLLLYSIRMIQGGVKRASGDNYKERMANVTSLPRSILTGMTMAIITQSSIAVTMLATAFSKNKELSFGVGLAMVIGADIGSSLLIQVLSFNLDWLMPLLMLSGGALFLKGKKSKIKQIGRILLGASLVLISLKFLREAVSPLASSDMLPFFSMILEQDHITAFIIGAGLAFVMHSSLAAILVILTLVSTNSVSFESGFSLVMGANFGSALVPLWLSRKMNGFERRIPWGNFIFRGLGASAFMISIHNHPQSLYFLQNSEEQVLVFLHIAFNLSLLLLLPLRSYLEILLEKFLGPNEQSKDVENFAQRSVFEYKMIDNPEIAYARLKREVLRMSELVKSIFEPLMIISKAPNKQQINLLVKNSSHLSDAFDMIRKFVSEISKTDLKKGDRRRLRSLIAYSTQLQRTGQIVTTNLLPRFKEIPKSGLQLSQEGENELIEIHTKLNQNLSLATNFLLDNKLNTAKLIIENKNAISKLLRTSQKKHFERVSKGVLKSIASSNLHLELLHSFRDMNGRFASNAYPSLSKADLLNDSLLID